MPAELIVAIVVGRLVHVPPATGLDNAIVLPTQTGILLAINPGSGITVRIVVTVPQVVV
jgi:hypothetical protein